MDRLQAMGLVVAAVEGGSLSAAARKLGMPLPTVSRKVAELEAHLKARLLVRSTRRLRLTDAGQNYLAACRKILDDVAEAERLASGEYRTPRGQLIVAAPIVFGRQHVLPVALEFLQAYPDVDLQLALGDRVLNLLDEQVDAAVRIGELPDSSLVASRVGLVRQWVCASPAYLKRRGVPRTPDDLARHDCVTFESLGAAHAWTFRDKGGSWIVPVRSRLTVNTAEAAIDAAIQGLGVTRVLSYQVREPVRAGRLVVILKSFEPPPSPVSLVRAAHPVLPLKLRAFLDFAGPRLRAALK